MGLETQRDLNLSLRLQTPIGHLAKRGCQKNASLEEKRKNTTLWDQERGTVIDGR